MVTTGTTTNPIYGEIGTPLNHYVPYAPYPSYPVQHIYFPPVFPTHYYPERIGNCICGTPLAISLPAGQHMHCPVHPWVVFYSTAPLA